MRGERLNLLQLPAPSFATNDYRFIADASSLLLTLALTGQEHAQKKINLDRMLLAWPPCAISFSTEDSTFQDLQLYPVNGSSLISAQLFRHVVGLETR